MAGRKGVKSRIRRNDKKPNKAEIRESKAKNTREKKRESNKDFIKRVLQGSKDFLKREYRNVNKHAKDILQYFKKEYGTAKNGNMLKIPGTLWAYRYDAKYKEHTFDKKPLIISLGPPKNRKLKDHVYGLNIHWLPYNERVAVANYFLELRKKKQNKLTYRDVKPWLKRYKDSKVLRLYIIKRISNNVIRFPVDGDAYLIAASLKTEKFIRGLK